MKFETTPQGPFDLAASNRYFGGWTSIVPDPSIVALAFPVEGWRTSSAVVLHQHESGSISGEIYGQGEEGVKGKDAEMVWKQALATLSLDSDGTGWPEIGQRDAFIGDLQKAHNFLRPVLFHSPYEAAAAFIIGHRISIQQGRTIRLAMAQESGEKIVVGETELYAFPRPQGLLELSSFKGVNAEKIQRLHGIAQAALDGVLDRTLLRSMPVEQALETLRSLTGIGPFFSQGILLRGAGLVDAVADDAMTKEAIQLAYKLPQSPDQKTVLQIAEAWRPYRMWTNVLLHVWLRRDEGGPRRQRERRASRR